MLLSPLLSRKYFFQLALGLGGASGTSNDGNTGHTLLSDLSPTSFFSLDKIGKFILTNFFKCYIDNIVN